MNGLGGAVVCKKRHIIGLTGPMAAGKDSAADILRARGFVVLDADKIAHGILESQRESVLELFESDAQRLCVKLTNADGSIHRKNLGRIVFSFPQKLEQLEQLIHPVLNGIIEKRIADFPSVSFVINAAVLHNMEVIKNCDIVLYINAPCFIRFMRVKKRDNLSFKRISERFFAQRKIFAKCKKQNADIYRVGNFGTKKQLKNKIEAALRSSII